MKMLYTFLMFKDPLPTSQRTHLFFLTNINRLHLSKVAVGRELDTGNTNGETEVSGMSITAVYMATTVRS